MRFEIGKGAVVVIVGGLIGLSGAVFALGLIAGQEIARQNNQDSTQVATVMPLPSPLAEPTAAPELREAAAASPPAPLAVSTPAPAPRSASAPPLPNPPAKSQAVASAPTGNIDAAAGEAPAKMHARSPVSDTEESSAEPAVSTPPAHGHEYNIQIEAVMDRDGADAMVQRLQALGYHSYEVATVVNGETWYRVRVGPYASADEAKAAEGRLHEQYRAAYTTR
ncbi:MAG TPA: SPOR domain-containing protein [Candidatus Binataceae bacterium]|nr:SPOR domain-containing protein [Candidatus Binataceae bacterium]